MHNLLFIFLSAVIFFLACSPDNPSKQMSEKFSNPILAGFYPDPSMCRVGDNYYLVNSTFAYFPGIPIFQSQDLINWKLIGHVMDRPEQMDLTGLGVSRGIFAPAIRYHNGVYYLTCTLVDAGGNFVVTAQKPEGPWSNPVWLPQINGIDPSLFFDDDGKAFIIYNSIAPDDKPLYDGHRTLRMYEFDREHLKVTGEEVILINGGTDINNKPVWIEGPHIFKKDGYYYLIAAEGGTAEQHSEVVFRSTRVTGPYIPYVHNPILTQRHLNPEREHPITCTGHADFVETQTGEWWAVFLGCRPYRPFSEGYYNNGRETFLAPVRWIDGWPVINPGHEEVQYYYSVPNLPVSMTDDLPLSDNFQYRDNFDTEKLNLHWMFLRTPHEKWYDLKQKNGFLAMKLRPETCAGNGNPGFLGRRQQHAEGSVSISLDFIPRTENEKAGLLVFQNEQHFYFICKSLKDRESIIQLYKSTNEKNIENQMVLIASQKIDSVQSNNNLYLKIEAHGNVYSFLFAYQPDKWILLKDKIDATFLSTRVAGGFVGCIYALYTTSLGESSQNSAFFDWFDYQGNDEVYR